MPAKKSRIALTVTLLLAFAALVTGIFVSQHMNGRKTIDVSKFHGTLLQQPREIQQFSLTGTDEAVFDNQSMKGQWTMIFFGFTNCGYLCPTTMGELAKMYRQLEQKGVNPLPRVVMISIDPDRDNTEKLKNYVTSFDSHFYGARGNMDKIHEMTHEMGIAYSIQTADKTNGNYDIQHSGAVMLFNPQGELAAFFTTPHKADQLAEDYQLLVN
ncbi:SCO family protein [Legionella dresdenensis]|uniref:SCO family protein n=1 Tax=Legionella dresdenensis TaxID=450200 RepID=A0ABV8CFY1_9GAMM